MRTWSDETTVASHESLTLRAEFDHDARHRGDVAWTFAAYENPVGERLWHATASATTPTALVCALLDSLAGADPWSSYAFGVASHPADTTAALLEAGWALHDSTVVWQAPDASASFAFSPYDAEHPHSALPAWMAYGGTDPNYPAWAIHLSPATPPDVLGALAFELAANASLAEPRPSRSPQATRPATPASAQRRSASRP
ncbi:DUF317 domain-containing protein [Streptomyces sp. NPDC001436]